MTLNINNKQPELIWYLGYGSNLNTQRFLIYILGGRAKGGKITQLGCSDHTLPRDDRPFEIPASLYFADHSFIYNGGVAFIDQSKPIEAIKARGYLITRDQFCSIIAQENIRDYPIVLPGLADFPKNGYVLDNKSGDPRLKYTRVIYCGEHAGYPMLSITAGAPYTEFNRPSPAYLQTISLGLKESHGLSNEAITDYLINKPGVAGNYTRSELMGIA